MWLRALALPCGLLLAGCGPYLREVRTGEAQAFETSAPCAQGPLRLEARLEGARWGEFVRLSVASPRALVGQVRVLVDGVVVQRHAWRTATDEPVERGATRSVVDRVRQNQRCVERPAVATEGTAAPEPAVAAGDAEPVERAWETLPSPAPASAAQAAASVAVALVPTERAGCGGHTGEVVLLSRRNETRDGAAPFAAGAHVVVELWSEEPNDFEGACLVAERGQYVPSSTEAKWLEELARREVERAREAQREQAEAQREAERWRAEAAARARRCAAHPEDVDCRPPPVARAAPRRAAEPPQPPPPPQPHEPDGPPPEPRQAQPAAVVPWATWVPGYWQWTGFAWVWLDGWWKVDAARLASANAQATAPCPPPRVEAPPPRPLPSAEWHVGVWLWAGLRWVWLPGQWRQPPHPAVPVPSPR